MKRERDGRRVEDNDCSISEKGLVFDEEEAEDDCCEEEDVSALSGLDNYQLCLKYQQVLCVQPEVLAWVHILKLKEMLKICVLSCNC